MDFTTPLIFIAIFALASLSLFLVYKFGMQPKSYEEALAEQRQQTSALLGVKPKPKEKKSKKSAKKEKSKENAASSIENETTPDETEVTPNHDNLLKPPHIEFKEEPEELDAAPTETVQQKKRTNKVRPILVKKEKSPIRIAPIVDGIAEIPPANKFEEIHPKDEFELLKYHTKHDNSKPEHVTKQELEATQQPKEGSPPAKPDPSPSAKFSKKTKIPPSTQQKLEDPKSVEPEVTENEKEDKSVENIIVPKPQPILPTHGKEKKKKKTDVAAGFSPTAERDQLINSVRKAELSRTEVQMLIDLLLNKQLEAPAVIDEWSEGKSDPIQKLKKQLAEKEKLLEESQEALLGVQNKLKEVRGEQVAEKAQLQQKFRGFEEILQGKQLELQNSNSRLQLNSQKLQQLQAQINEEIMKNHKLVEDNNALQIQRQQLEAYTRSIQENEGLLLKLRSEGEELIRQNQHLGIEIQRISQDSAEKEQQHFIMQTNMQNDLDQYNERVRGLEEALRDLERKLEVSLRQENDRNIEVNQVHAEKHRLEINVEQMQNELHLLQNDKVENLKKIAQLNSDVKRLEQEKSVHQNGLAEETKAKEVKLLNLSNELSSAKTELHSINKHFLDAEKTYKSEMETTNSKVNALLNELEQQKEKNNELREKNWKVVEALNAAESKLKQGSQTTINIDKLTADIKAQEKNSQKEFIQRLFPEIEDLKNISNNDWQSEYMRLINDYISAQVKEKGPAPSNTDKGQDIAKLQSQISHYKNVIDDTEGMLNNLQLHIEREERNWRTLLAAKDSELEALKENQLAQLQSKVISLERQLAVEQSEKERLFQGQHAIDVKSELKTVDLDSIATIEKLSEEVNRLREQLMRIEEAKSSEDMACPINKVQICNSNSANGPSHIEDNGN